MEYQHLSEAHLLNFYGWWQFGVCLFAFVALLAIWWHIGKKRADFGQVWLALSVLCWSLSGLTEIYFSNRVLAAWPVGYDIAAINELLGEQSQAQAFWRDGFRSIFSLLNSLFILLALPWFKYIPQPIRPLIKSNFWYWIVGIPFLFAIIPTGIRLLTGQTISLIAELDVYFSIMTLVFLGWVLWSSFARRRLQWLAILSAICIAITFVAQLYKLVGSNIDLTLYSAIFKTCLIMIFFALAMSWVKELAENIIPESGMLKLLLRNENQNGVGGSFKLEGLPGINAESVSISATNFELLRRFAHQKKNGQDPWLEIKPKNDSRSGKTYDINDHNEIKRLLTAMLDGVFGKNAWSKEHHFLPLKNALFLMSTNRDRKVQLKIPATNISIEEA